MREPLQKPSNLRVNPRIRRADEIPKPPTVRGEQMNRYYWNGHRWVSGMDITTPCHGKPLRILTTYEGGYMGREVPDEIICTAEGCHNSWNADGTEVK